MRVLAGVSESLLAHVPEQRSRYTALGGVVIGTATIATFSMWMALNETAGSFSLLWLLPALLWGLFIVNFDRLLVSSATGTRWGRRVMLLVGRLLLAAMFGIVIAEPLVLGIFQTAIVKHVKDTRADALRTLASTYVQCNPPPGNSPPSGDSRSCVGYRLSLPADTSGVSGELAADQGQAEGLQSTIDTETKQQNDLDSQAAAECAGTSGSGLTGVPGNGPLCRQRTQAAQQYQQTHPVAQQQSQLQSLRSTIDGLQQSRAGQQGSFLAARAAAISQKVDQERSHQGAIGLLERFQALHQLMRTDDTVTNVVWALSIFFVLVDCTPALSKLLSGVTEYDRLAARQSSSAGRIFDAARTIEEERALGTLESERHRTAARVGMSKADADIELRQHEVEANRRLDDQVEHAASRLLHQMRGHRKSGRHG